MGYGGKDPALGGNHGAIKKKKVDEHIEKTIYEMPAAKKERLAAEIEHFDVDVARL
jgi:hypothetical protein